MKYALFIITLALAGCCATPTESDRWKEIKDLTGEPLVIATLKDSEPAFSELYERRRSVGLEIARLEPEVKSSEEKARAYAIQKALYESFTQKLYEEALSRKMSIWKTTHTQK